MQEKQMLKERIYDVEHNKLLTAFHKIYVAVAILFCIFLVGILLYTVSYLPETGNPANPADNEVAARYIEQGLQETGAVNIVSGMILTYRAFDTFGETNVLFIATCCVMILLMVDDAILKKQEVKNDRRFEPKNDAILQATAFVLCPLIFIFGIYIILNGHLSPGGGFSGGAVMGAGMILYVSAFGFKKTQKFFNEHVYKAAKITALIMYGIIGSYFYITGANGIENHIPLGIPGHILSSGIILPINVCVGLEVACTMYAFYALFRRGGL
jgi:multicomponent Na+:H+ antiporter subunit B